MRKRGLLSLAATLGMVAGGLSIAVPGAGAQTFTYSKMTPIQKRHVSGDLAEELGTPRARAAVATTTHRASASPCGMRRGDNVKVDQDCLTLADPALAGRSQAKNETWIAYDPSDPNRLVASYNDYRRGDGTCGVSYSGNGGASWTDTTTPNGFVDGSAFGGFPREYFQAGGDTSVAWDTRGNVYLSCQQFKRGTGVTEDADQSSGFYLFRSTGTNGSSFNFPGRPVMIHNDIAGAGNVLIDKALMTVDDNVSSPFRDRIYETWTTFAADGTAYIYEAYSDDYGESFSAPVLVSSDSALCGQTYGVPTPSGRCNDNQFSQPVVGPDGTLYVTWANYNVAETGNDNRFQVMLATSTDGGATFSAPVKVANYYDLPDCATYQAGADPGRDCVPEKGTTTNSIFRATNYPYAAVDPANPHEIVVTVGSYINKDSNESNGCAPAGLNSSLGSLYTGVKTGGCNNKIVMSVSTNGGKSFTGTATDVRSLPVIGGGTAFAASDQYFQGTAFSPRGTLVTDFYDRQYGSDETTGFSDVTLTTTRDLVHFADTRVTSSSMPPPSQFIGAFYGDYIQVAASASAAYPVWSDTRADALFLCPGTGRPGLPPQVCTATAANAAVANNEDIYTATVPLR